MKKRNLNMTSSKSESDLMQIYYEDALDYIDERMQAFSDNKMSLFIAELQNGEKIVCLCDMDNEYVLYLPVHLVDSFDENGRASYLLYPYCNLADECSELVLSDAPKVLFGPSKSVIDNYFKYWQFIQAKYLREISGNTEEQMSFNEPITSIKS